MGYPLVSLSTNQQNLNPGLARVRRKLTLTLRDIIVPSTHFGCGILTSALGRFNCTSLSIYSSGLYITFFGALCRCSISRRHHTLLRRTDAPNNHVSRRIRHAAASRLDHSGELEALTTYYRGRCTSCSYHNHYHSSRTRFSDAGVAHESCTPLWRGPTHHGGHTPRGLAARLSNNDGPGFPRNAHGACGATGYSLLWQCICIPQTRSY